MGERVIGYTHYHTQTQKRIKAEQWAEICADVRAIIEWAGEHAVAPEGTEEQIRVGVKIVNGGGEAGTEPEITKQHIFLNGEGETGYETFALYRAGRPKTTAADWPHLQDNPTRLQAAIDHFNKDRYAEFTKTDRREYDVVVTAILCYLASIQQTHNSTSDGNAEDWTAGLELARAALPKYANQLDYPSWLLQEDVFQAPWVSMETEKYAVRFTVFGPAYIVRNKDKAAIKFADRYVLAKWLVERKAALGEPDIWKASGYFNADRRKNLARLQEKVITPLFSYQDENQRRYDAVPTEARPGTYKRPAFAYYLEDVLKIDGPAEQNVVSIEEGVAA